MKRSPTAANGRYDRDRPKPSHTNVRQQQHTPQDRLLAVQFLAGNQSISELLSRESWCPYIQRQADDSSGDISLTEFKDGLEKLHGLHQSIPDAANALASVPNAQGKDVPVIVSSLLGVGESLEDVVAEYEKFRTGTPVEVESRLAQAKKVVDGFQLLVEITDQESLQGFLNNPTFETGFAWAEDVGATFNRIADIVPENLPFVSPMLKGLLSAPENYLRAFHTLLAQRLGEIDKAAGLSGDESKYTEGDQVVWSGPLARLYLVADPALRTFMHDHNNEGGVNLRREKNRFVAVAHLMALVRKYTVDTTDETANLERRQRLVRWTNLLERYLES